MKFKRDLPESGGKNYLKLKSGESITGIFMGEPYEFYSLWEQGKPREVPAGTPGAGFRFRINFVVKEGGVYVPKIFEQGVTVYKQLDEINTEYPLETTVIKISRSGSSISDTTYSLLPLLNKPIDAQTMAHLRTIELHDLGTKKSDYRQEDPMPQASDEIPF